MFCLDFSDQNNDDFINDIDDVPRFIKKISEMKICLMLILKFMIRIIFLKNFRDQNDDDFIDDIDDVPRLRRVAPPPPPEFQSRPSRRYPSPPPQQPPSR